MTKSNSPLVLVVDDEATGRFLLRRVLEQDGYLVREATNGLQGLAAYRRFRPDIVFLDALMPEMNGFEACAKLRQFPGGDRVPVLMITALDDASSVDRAFEVGATEYIVKPINIAAVRRRVSRLLQAG